MRELSNLSAHIFGPTTGNLARTLKPLVIIPSKQGEITIRRLFEGFVSRDMMRGLDQCEAGMLTSVTRREFLAIHASHFVLLPVLWIMNDLVDARPWHRLTGLEHVPQTCHSPPLNLDEYSYLVLRG
jgi:hypothetical protein